MRFDELFDDKAVAAYIRDIFDSTFSGFKPSLDLYIATAEYLDSGLFQGFGQTLFDIDPDSPDAELLRDLRDNVHVFSAFKSHHSAELIGELIWDNNGNKRPFNAFRDDAMKMFGITHDRHLKTEFRTSVANGRGAAQWRDITRDVEQFPFLKYVTVGDERVRPEHENFDGITRRADDKFWRTHFPPNGFNCRCDSYQQTGFERGFQETPTRVARAIPEPPELFRMNAGVDRVVFDPKHPAFTVADRFKVAAKKMFGLPLLFGRHGET